MRRRLRVGLLCAGVFLGAPTARAGVFPGAAWDVATPASQELDATELDAAMAYLASRSGSTGTDQALVVRHGYLVWDGGDLDNQHNTWSLTKPFVSTVLGLLVDDGACTLDTLAATYVPDLVPLYPTITLRHFATMTSGYDGGGDQSATPFNPTAPLFVPGQAFAYWDSAMNQNASVLTQIALEPIEDLFKREIADPIGMDASHWSWGDFGTVGGFTVNGGAGNKSKGISISARELARFGLLFLNRGDWNGQQLISQDWVDQATSVQVAASVPEDPNNALSPYGPGAYGFNWWVNGVEPDGERIWPQAPTGTYQAIGFNNNRLVVIPEWEMVVVRLGTDGHSVDHSELNTFVSLLEDSVLSANLHRGTAADALNVHQLEVTAPCVEDDPGTLGDGQTYYYRIEEHGGVPRTVTVEKATGNDAVRICF